MYLAFHTESIENIGDVRDGSAEAVHDVSALEGELVVAVVPHHKSCTLVFPSERMPTHILALLQILWHFLRYLVHPQKRFLA